MRFGILCTGTDFQLWQANAVRELIARGHEPVLLVIDARKISIPPFIQRIFKKNPGTLLFSFLDNRVFKPPAKHPVSMEGELAGVPRLHCIVSKNGYSEYFTPGDIGRIREAQPDFLLRFGFGILRGEILDAAKHGVWSFHHDDEQIYRGGPPGFWEIFHGDPKSGAILQRLTPRLDAGIILQKGYFRTVDHSYCGNLQQLLTGTSGWPAKVATELEKGLLSGTESGTSPTSAPVYKVPRNRQMVGFLMKLLRNKFRFYVREYLLAEQWNTGIIQTSQKELFQQGLKKLMLKAENVEWMPQKGRRFYIADPFGFEQEGRIYILAEQFDYQTMCGNIVLSEYNASQPNPQPSTFNIQPSTPSLPPAPPHLSYPFLVEENETIYCIPETYRNKQVVLYRLDTSNHLMIRERVLLDGVEAVDPTLVKYQGKWWLFCTDKAHSNTHLSVYFSEDLHDEFLPHPMNPVKIDISSSRPAGNPVVLDGILYRPAQDCASSYGSRIIVHKVGKLTESAFSEEPAFTIEPGEGIFRHGLHTISQTGPLTLIDGKRYRLNLYYFIGQIKKKFQQRS